MEEPTPEERKGRFKIKRVDSAEAGDESSMPDDAIVGGRIKPMEVNGVVVPLQRPGAEDGGVVAVAPVVVGVLTQKGEKKGRFIIRELPEQTLTDVNSHVQIDLHPHVHPYKQQHPHMQPQVNPATGTTGSRQSLSSLDSSGGNADSLGFKGVDTMSSSMGSMPQISPLVTPPSGTAGSVAALVHASHESSPIHPPDYDLARVIKAQNDQILLRLQGLDRTLHHPAVSSALSGAASVPPDKGGGTALTNKASGTGGGGGAKDSEPMMGKDQSAGKMMYLLEQMKLEVEAKAARRKELELQNKRLQEKNRALEEKLDDEKGKRLAAEKTAAKLREKAEQLAAEVHHLQELLLTVQQHQHQQQSQQQLIPSGGSSSIPPSLGSNPGLQPGTAMNNAKAGTNTAQGPTGASNLVGDLSGAAPVVTSFPDFIKPFAAPLPTKPHVPDLGIDDLVSAPPPVQSLPPRASSSPVPIPMPTMKRTSSQVHLEQQQQRPISGQPQGNDPFNDLMRIGQTTNVGVPSQAGHLRAMTTLPAREAPQDEFAELVTRSNKQPPSSSSSGNSNVSSKQTAHTRRESSLV